MNEWSWVAYFAGALTPIVVIFSIAIVRAIKKGPVTSGQNSVENVKENVVVVKGD